MDLYKGPGGPHFPSKSSWGPRCDVTIFRWWINACIGRQHEPKMTQHGSYIGAQGFKNIEKHNVFQTFSFLHNVTMLPSYVSPWPFFWTSLAPFGTLFSSTPPLFLMLFQFFQSLFFMMHQCMHRMTTWSQKPKMTQHDSYIGAEGFKNSEKHNVFQTFSFLDNVAIWPSYVSPWALLWTSLAPFGTTFSSNPSPFP